jgi:hypothetical protein
MGMGTVEHEGWNCFNCQHRHAGKALAYICIRCPCRFRYCEGCQTAIDPETCGCGSPMKDHGAYEGHMAIPMGCGCYRASPIVNLNIDPFDSDECCHFQD